MQKMLKELSPECKKRIMGITDAQDMLGGKWKLSIMSTIYYFGVIRFMDLKRHIGDISPKVLSSELKDLEMNHLVKRTVRDTQPITVEYELTSVGKSFNKVVDALGDWGIAYRKVMLKK